MNTNEALQLFKLTLPTTANVIKTTYRHLSRLEHPDHSRHPDAKARFQKIVDAYTILILKSDLAILEDTGEVTETESGDKLANLGAGLGPTTNGATCGDCDGKGYRIVPGLDFRECTNCRPIGISIFGNIVEVKCWKCEGSGDFSRGGKVIGRCFNCSGNGWVRANRFTHPCRVCHGTGTKKVPARKTYHTCSRCKGTGELPMWNPVIPKGLLGVLT